MKKVATIISAILLMSSSASAQLSLGGGYATPNKGGLGDEGYYLGGDYNYQINKHWGVAPGLYYTKGYCVYGWYQPSPTGGSFREALEEQYIGIPVNFNYRFSFSSKFALLLYTGTTFSYGLTSNRYTYSTIHLKSDLYKEGYNNMGYKYRRYDILWGGGLALEFFDKIRLSMGKNYGLLNRIIAPKGENYSNHRYMVYAGVAYLF